jgi:chromosome segregation ATPase
MKTEAEKRLHDLLAQLQQERDQLRLRTHLLKADLKQEWDDVELKMHSVETRLRHLRTSVHESSEDIGTATNLLLGEITNAYKRFHDAINR